MEMKLYTTKLTSGETTETRVIFTDDGGRENELVNIYPHMTFQTVEGFGGAFTDSSGYVYSLMGKADQKRLMEAYFGKGGAGYRLGRVPLDSCDFSIAHYEAMSRADLSAMNLERQLKYIGPLIDDAQTTLGRPIDFAASFWSPPAFMKTNGERNGGGALKDEFMPLYAAYIAAYIKEMRRHGCHITRLTAQNEPKAVQTWDSCVYSAEREKVFIRDHLYPALVENGLDDVKIFIWDHNKERAFERAEAILDGTTGFVDGVAFHWYSGDHFEALDLIRRKYPGLKLIQSELCMEYRHYGKDDVSAARRYAHEFIGDLNAGACAFYDWNIVLDQHGGPNHVGNFCGAPFHYDTETKKLTEAPAFACISHFSRHIKPGAVRIGTTRYTADIEAAAFRNTDGTVALVALNAQKRALPAHARLGGMAAEMALPAETVTTAVISGVSAI